MRMKSSIVALALLVAAGALAFAQAGQTLILEYVDGSNLTVVYPDQTSYSYANGSIQEGDAVPVGSTVKTGAGTSIELKLKPNGTVIKLAKMTTFRVETLGTPQKDQNGFTLVGGKIRAVAAVGSQYTVYTASTVAGVRGTDFTMAFEEGAKATLLVTKGAVEFARRAADGSAADAIMVAAGQFADFFKSFTPAPFTPEQLSEEYGDVNIDPTHMPAQAEDKQAGSGDQQPADTAATPAQAEAAKAQTSSAFMEWLRDSLGMEIGSITINGDTWAKAVIQPTITLGKLRAGLYLPIIYSDNLFNPSTWYKPAGNNEWSFGTDVGWSAHPAQAALDAATDLALKFKFIEYGKPLVDPFFLKVGNLNDFTIGHGLLMRNYANDSDFPSVRRIGLLVGLDQGSWGFEAMTNDLTDNQILGGRLYVRPLPESRLALGISSVVDLYPASMVDTAIAPDKYGDPMFIGAAADLDLPIITTSLLGIRFFADGGAMVPYVRTGGVGSGDAGLRYDMVYDNGAIRNWGAMTGFMGNVLFLDWRLEYRYFTGAFSPSFFDSGYDRRRGELVAEWAQYLSGTTAIDQAPSVMGIYGEGSASIINDKLSLKLGYFWPWSATATSLDEQLSTSDDYFTATLVVKKGLIPVINASGAIRYERRHLIQSIIDGGSLFDENTIFSGELAAPVPGAPNLDLALVVSTMVSRDTNGDIEYTTSGNPKIVPAVTLETRLHF